MTGNIVARRYAQALFALGKSSGLPELDRYSAELAELRSAIAASPDLVRVFKNPIFSADEKKQVVQKLAKKLKLEGAVFNFCLLLADKGRLDCLDAIGSAFGELLDAEKGVLRGTLYTAVKLDDARQADIVGRLEKQTGRSLALEFGVSPEILGGVVLRVGDQVMDASLRAQLSILKDTIKRGE